MQEERYEIRGKIGQGGVGAVYRAYDTHLKREVAIKRVLADEAALNHENATNNLLKEATALSSVQHPHICTVYDAGIDEEGPFVVMELINGKTLDKMIEKGTLTYKDFREVAIQTQEAMIAAQDLNLVHRDLKPSNVMVSWLPSGRFQIKLVDFGLAKFSAKPSLQTIDHGDSVFGSIFFMAPEQFERTPLDQRTDMYSLGALYYYSLTGSYPFDGETAPQVMASHLQNTVVPLQQLRPDLPVWLCEWVMWHIQREMDHRPPSARIALEKFLADEALAAQGGLGQTQQLHTPGAPKSSTTPLLIIPNASTGPQAVRPGHLTGPLNTVTGAQPVRPGHLTGPLNPATAPQPILTPAGTPSVHTSAQSIHAPTPPAPPTTGGPPPAPPAPPTPPAGGIPPAPPTGAHPEQLDETLEHKPKISQKNKIIIISLLSLLIIAALIWAFNRKSEEKNDQELAKIINNDNVDPDVKDIPITKKQLMLALDAMAGPIEKDRAFTNSRNGIVNILFKCKPEGDFNLAQEIADFALNEDNDLTEENRGNLLKNAIWVKPHDKKVLSQIIDFASSNPDRLSASTALAGTISMIDHSHAKKILSIMTGTKNSNMKGVCEKLIKKLLLNDGDSKNTSQAIVASFKNPITSSEDKSRLIRIMGSSHSPEALELILAALHSDSPKDVSNAHRALARWKDLKPFPKLIELVDSSDSDKEKVKILSTMVQLLRSQPNAKDSKYAKKWQELVNLAPSPDFAFKILNARQRMSKEDWVKSELIELTKDENLSARRKRTIREILDEWNDE